MSTGCGRDRAAKVEVVFVVEVRRGKDLGVVGYLSMKSNPHSNSTQGSSWRRGKIGAARVGMTSEVYHANKQRVWSQKLSQVMGRGQLGIPSPDI
jgi:hypothetical protein